MAICPEISFLTFNISFILSCIHHLPRVKWSNSYSTKTVIQKMQLSPKIANEFLLKERLNKSGRNFSILCTCKQIFYWIWLVFRHLTCALWYCRQNSDASIKISRTSVRRSGLYRLIARNTTEDGRADCIYEKPIIASLIVMIAGEYITVASAHARIGSDNLLLSRNNWRYLNCY